MASKPDTVGWPVGVAATALAALAWWFASGVEPDFIEHAPEINEAANFVVVTAKSRYVRHGRKHIQLLWNERNANLFLP